MEATAELWCGPPQHGLSSKNDDPNHLGLRCNAVPEHQMALITSGCVPFTGAVSLKPPAGGDYGEETFPPPDTPPPQMASMRM